MKPKWIPDKTGRFINRPHYPPELIDFECEKLIEDFLLQRNGRIEYPISTDDLMCLLEDRTEDFDRGADLSEEEGEVDGVTEFELGKKPRIKISHLLDNSRMENRFRTTLTHELFHAIFHDCMFQIESKPPSLFENVEDDNKMHREKCKRDNITGAKSGDWMEWQAGYGCGAFLIPVTSLKQKVTEFFITHEFLSLTS